MSRAQQPSIRSFFQPRRLPEYAPPPSSSTSSTTAPPPPDAAASSTTTPPPAPPPPPASAPPSSTARSKIITIPITLPPNGVPILPSPPSLPAGASIVPLAEHHIPALRRINSLLLPVPYPDSFYAKALDPLASGLFSRAILWQDSDADAPKVIGGLICRLEPNPFLDVDGRPLPNPSPPAHPPAQSTVPPDTPYHAIYIQSLALLSPYRSLGLAAAALEHIVASALLLPAAGSNIDARTIYAHVWTENGDGLKWYEARGFAREGAGPVQGYYFKLRPDTAWVVRRHIGAHAALAAALAPSASPLPPPPSSSSTARPNVLTAALNLPPTSSPSPSSLPPPPRSTSTSTTGGPPRRSPAPSPSSSTLSFQNTRPESEWNDLPAEMVVAPQPQQQQQQQQQNQSQNQLLTPNTPGSLSGGPPSGASSRSSSAAAPARKRKERAYPSAAFGGQ